MATGSGQPLPPSRLTSLPYTYPPIIVVLTTILFVFFVGFFFIYFCRCISHLFCSRNLRQSPTGTPVHGAASVAASRGLDPQIVQSFPSFTYSTVKEYRKEKYGLECAICLLEFKGADLLRLLTTCYHVFHQECIDLWLESQNTCPVCRGNLTSPVKSPNYMHEIDHVEDSHSITVKDENEDETRASDEGQGDSRDIDEQRDIDKQNKIEKFSKSHSTGHSILRKREEDRYTLRLPEHVKTRIIRGHNSSKSWTNFGEYKDKTDGTNIGLAEVSGVSSGDNKV